MAKGFTFGSTSSKSLSEQVNDICKSNMGRVAKIDALKVCGLNDVEISVALTKFVRPASSDKFTYTFGVEIECLHANRTALVEAGLANGIDVRPQSYNHQDNDTYYKVVSDASVGGDVDPNEIVSPVLQGNRKGFASIKAVTKTLDAVDARVNKTCGLHVHIGAKDITDKQYINVFKNYQKLELLIDSFMAPSRRGDSRYSKSLLAYDFSGCYTKDDVYNKLYSRYFNVNPASWMAHRTIEFRQHQGTTDYTKIVMWVNFVAKLVGWSKDNVLQSTISNIEDVPFLNKKEKDFFKSRIEAFAR